MRRTIKLWEVYVTRFEDALERHRLGRLSADEAGEALGMSGRQFRRLRVRFAAAGAEGLRDHRLGRVSGRRAPEAELDRMHRLYREEYADFTAKHFHEELRRRHNYTLGYTVTRLGGKVDKTRPTQVGRALAQLGIRHIPAYSPEARGRMERAFGTLQGRLPQALRGGHQVVVLKVQLPAGPEPALEQFLRDWTPQDARDPRAGMVA